MKKFLKDFKVFITRGNIIDLAVAVIIGTAFGAIVTSLVKDIIMPLVSIVFGGTGFENLKIIITPADPANNIAENSIRYGVFINAVVNFLTVALCIFLILRFIMSIKNNADKLSKKIKKKEAPAPEAEKKLTTEELLEKIFNLLQHGPEKLEKNLKNKKEDM